MSQVVVPVYLVRENMAHQELTCETDSYESLSVLDSTDHRVSKVRQITIIVYLV